MQVVLQTL
jgi:hypothetical protein